MAQWSTIADLGARLIIYDAQRQVALNSPLQGVQINELFILSYQKILFYAIFTFYELIDYSFWFET